MGTDGDVRDVGDIDRLHKADATYDVVASGHGGTESAYCAHLFVVVEYVKGADVVGNDVEGSEGYGRVVRGNGRGGARDEFPCVIAGQVDESPLELFHTRE